MNEVDATVKGNVGSDVERVRFENGNSIVRFSLAHSRRYVNRDGEWVDGPTTWYRVNCRRALADNVADCVRKGQAVIVQGSVRLDAWEQQDGGKRETLVLDAVAVGHDLNRGTSNFVKVTRQQSADHSGDQADDVESSGPAPEFAGADPWANGAKESERPSEEALTPA